MADCEIKPIREKFGIAVFRVKAGEASYIGKYFAEKHDRKEIQYYHILQSIGVPTLGMPAQTDCLMLLEDIEESETYRLGTEQDMSDCAIARRIAAWFKQLHTSGRNSECLQAFNFPDHPETELRMRNITNAMDKSNTRSNPFWALLLEHIEGIKSAYTHLCDTIAYSDFWWDNMAVARDGSSALMFDYNCMYHKYAWADIRHILSVLSKEAGEAFLEAYGPYSGEEKAFEDVFFPLTGLLSAHQMADFPVWAHAFTDMLHSGELAQRIDALIEFLY